jgi:hypothetical protein
VEYSGILREQLHKLTCQLISSGESLQFSNKIIATLLLLIGFSFKSPAVEFCRMLSSLTSNDVLSNSHNIHPDLRIRLEDFDNGFIVPIRHSDLNLLSAEQIQRLDPPVGIPLRYKKIGYRAVRLGSSKTFISDFIRLRLKVIHSRGTSFQITDLKDAETIARMVGNRKLTQNEFDWADSFLGKRILVKSFDEMFTYPAFLSLFFWANRFAIKNPVWDEHLQDEIIHTFYIELAEKLLKSSELKFQTIVDRLKGIVTEQRLSGYSIQYSGISRERLRRARIVQEVYWNLVQENNGRRPKLREIREKLTLKHPDKFKDLDVDVPELREGELVSKIDKYEQLILEDLLLFENSDLSDSRAIPNNLDWVGDKYISEGFEQAKKRLAMQFLGQELAALENSVFKNIGFSPGDLMVLQFYIGKIKGVIEEDLLFTSWLQNTHPDEDAKAIANRGGQANNQLFAGERAIKIGRIAKFLSDNFPEYVDAAFPNFTGKRPIKGFTPERAAPLKKLYAKAAKLEVQTGTRSK